MNNKELEFTLSNLATTFARAFGEVDDKFNLLADLLGCKFTKEGIRWKDKDMKIRGK